MSEDSITESSNQENKPKLRWYVVQAFSGYEARVQKTLLEHIEIHGLQDKFGQVLVPTEEVVEMRAGQKRKSARKDLHFIVELQRGNPSHSGQDRRSMYEGPHQPTAYSRSHIRCIIPG